MDFYFKMFEPKKVRNAKADTPIVQVRPNGRIIFNKKASEMLSSSNYCMLGYDPDKQTVGLLPLAEEKLNCFPIRYAAKGAYVGAKKFFKYFNILPGQLVENTPVSSNPYIGIKL